MKLTGGYVAHRRPLVRVGIHTHTSDLHEPISQTDLNAVNAIQATPWRVNTFVLDTMMDCWTGGRRLAGLEVGEPRSLPDRLPDETFQAMTEDDRKAYLRNRAEVHRENASIMGRSQAIWDSLAVAEELRGQSAIWFPHSRDFRGRLYPEATYGVHPQGSDVQRALIHFADGVPLGPDGLYWLCIRAANTYGKDKLSLEDRVSWAFDNRANIQAAAIAPMAGGWWTEADEPWSFLATCHELAQVWADIQGPAGEEAFVSHLPVPMDGSCNGLQHLAALGLDAIGARATNMAGGDRQDVYEEVAKAVRLQVEQDVLDGVDEARVWHGRITRQVVKRAVMTTPYGVTDRGIRDQLLNDGHVPQDDAVGSGAAADYLRDKLVAALGSTVSSARSIMAWLQTTADRLARAGLALEWTTPSGSRVRQAYHVQSRVDLDCLTGRVILYDEQKDGGLNTRKQALGASPNVIHSFDAAHLALTVNAGHDAGIGSWAMIHDSFGTHAGNTTKLAAILRQTFVDIYKVDWLQRLYQEFTAYAPHVAIDPPPGRGDFDITKVIDAPYFFS